MCRSTTISVVELQGVSQGNRDSGRERLRLPTASLDMIEYNCQPTQNNWGSECQTFKQQNPFLITSLHLSEMGLSKIV